MSGVLPDDPRLLPVTFESIPELGLSEINGKRQVEAMKISVANMVKCTCGDFPIPLPGGSFVKKVSCSVSIKFRSVIQDNRLSPAPDAITAMLGIYGHEQQHVQNWLSYITGTMAPKLAVHEAPWRTCCPSESELRSIELDVIGGFRAQISAEAGHAGSPFYGDAYKSITPLPDTTTGVLMQFYDSL